VEEVWYIHFGDGIEQVDPNQVLNAAWSEIVAQDPYAQVIEVRKYPSQFAIKIGHPETSAEVMRLGFPEPSWETRRLEPLSTMIILAIIAAAILSVGIAFTAWMAYDLFTRQYVARDPDTGEPVTVEGFPAYMAYLITNYPEAADYLQTLNPPIWWEGAGDIFKWVIVLAVVGAGIYISLPLLSKMFAPKSPPA